jgi:predicted enzyme related to lactoylglutathione lyase
MTAAHHAISYVELPVDDLAATRAFYERAFGWEFNDYGPEYAGIRAPDGQGEVGGLNPGGTPSPGGPLVLIGSHDLEASEAAVREAGGTIAQEITAYPGGRRFQFRDPSGNQLGVFQEDA